ncbi:hypothetical protein [Sphingomonas sp.]|uniref:hypothetical protein n=1 Tax=Sphingomonas sp. TaxID=28214 RepID=UPI001B003597|nr:hypothetical protein [Sphingomonas sp.]MBO9715051.1 hypothetical protein [Sphingomonas sp.]
MLAFLAPALPARADLRHTATWVVSGEENVGQTITRKRGELALFARIVPKSLFRLREDVFLTRKDKPYVEIPKGTLMTHVDGRDDMACEILRRGGSAFDCLSDTDHDGRFETFFATQVFNEIFLGSIGDDGHFRSLPDPATLDAVESGEAPVVKLGILNEGSSKLEFRYRICALIARDKIVFGSDTTSVSCLADRRVASLASMPIAINAYGSDIRVVEVTSKLATMQVGHTRSGGEFRTSWSM